MKPTINNSRAPARLAAYKKGAAEWEARYPGGPSSDWRRNRYGFLGDGRNWTSTGTRAYVAMNLATVEGLRDAGTSEKILGLRYSGWFADEFQDSIYRGQVWQLPARDGEPRYICGYSEPDSGVVILSASDGRIDITDDKRDAASWADSLAEKMAEWNRESSEAENKKNAAADEIAESRADFKTAAAGLREQLKIGTTSYTCELLRGELAKTRRRFKGALAELLEAKERAENIELYYAVK